MATGTVTAPATDAKVDTLLDWLEIVAFFDEFDRARIDELIGSMFVQSDTQSDDISEKDRINDRIREAIENELNSRKTALRDAYPFDLDGSGEELLLIGDREAPATGFYLVLLIASHITGSPILKYPPDEPLEQRMRRRVFQVLGTLVVAGLAQGPAVSVGYPRETKETILDVLRRAERWGFGLLPRDKPGRHATPYAKDGGIDVIGWTAVDRPPPPAIWFGQLASGENWKCKPVTLDYDNFINDFFEDRGTGQHNFLTVVPFRLLDDLSFDRANVVHRWIADRCRAPLYATQALELPDRGIELDEIGNIGQVVDWLRDYRRSVCGDQVA